MTQDCTLLRLRRSMRPYAGLAVIYGAVLLLCLWVSFTKPHSGMLSAVPLLVPAFAAPVYIGTRYRVALTDGMLVQHAFGMADVIIALSDIGKVRGETGAGRKKRIKRPFRRIAFYHMGNGQWIDVSLKHFAMSDIEALLRCIAVARPDLAADLEKTLPRPNANSVA